MKETERALNELASRLAGTKHEKYFAEMRFRYAYVLDAARKFRPDGDLLDIGCAPGHLAWVCAKSGYRVAGVDPHPEVSFVAGNPDGTPLDLISEAGIPTTASNLNTEPLEYADASFDIVLFNETLEHLEGPPHGAMLEIRRVLRPGGRLYLTTPNVAALRYRVRMLLGGNIHTNLEVLRTVAPYKLHNREYTLGEVEELARYAQLRVVRARQLHFGKGRPADALFRAATAPFPSLRSNLFLEAEAP